MSQLTIVIFIILATCKFSKRNFSILLGLGGTHTPYPHILKQCHKFHLLQETVASLCDLKWELKQAVCAISQIRRVAVSRSDFTNSATTSSKRDFTNSMKRVASAMRAISSSEEIAMEKEGWMSPNCALSRCIAIVCTVLQCCAAV